MPEANFVEMSETLKSDDSTTFLMVFSGPEGCLEPPKARKKGAETALRSKCGQKPTSGTKKAPKVAAEPSPERPRNGKRRPGGRPGGGETFTQCCRSAAAALSQPLPLRAFNDFPEKQQFRVGVASFSRGRVFQSGKEKTGFASLLYFRQET